MAGILSFILGLKHPLDQPIVLPTGGINNVLNALTALAKLSAVPTTQSMSSLIPTAAPLNVDISLPSPSSTSLTPPSNATDPTTNSSPLVTNVLYITSAIAILIALILIASCFRRSKSRKLASRSPLPVHLFHPTKSPVLIHSSATEVDRVAQIERRCGNRLSGGERPVVRVEREVPVSRLVASYSLNRDGGGRGKDDMDRSWLYHGMRVLGDGKEEVVNGIGRVADWQLPITVEEYEVEEENGPEGTGMNTPTVSEVESMEVGSTKDGEWMVSDSRL